jgi:hypothetical protein
MRFEPISQVTTLRGRWFEEYGLPNSEVSSSTDGAVNPGLVVPCPNNCLQHFGGGACRLRVEDHHRAALVWIGDEYGGAAGFSEREDATDPFVLLKRD